MAWEDLGNLTDSDITNVALAAPGAAAMLDPRGPHARWRRSFKLGAFAQPAPNLRAAVNPFDTVAAPLAAPLELARHLVCGAADYARRLGFEPAPDFEPAAGHLGLRQETSAITFGRYGVPLYVSGTSTTPPG